MLSVKGYVKVEGYGELPFLGTVNDFTLEEWTRKAADLAIKHFIEDHGYAPESAEQAFAYEKKKYEAFEQMQPVVKQEIPVKRGNEIIYRLINNI